MYLENLGGFQLKWSPVVGTGVISVVGAGIISVTGLEEVYVVGEGVFSVATRRLVPLGMNSKSSDNALFWQERPSYQRG